MKKRNIKLKTVFMGPVMHDWSLINNSVFACLNGIEIRDEEPEDIGDNSGIEPEIPLSDEETNSTDDQSTTNDLKEFGVDTDEPDLFNSEDQNNNIEDLLNSSENEDEDDLEIPAFLRRQKN